LLAASTIDRVQSAQPGALREGPGVVARVAPACEEGEETACEPQSSIARGVRRPSDAIEARQRHRGLDKQIRAAEQPGSGLVRTLVMHDQKDPSQVYTLVVFESEEQARA
jgi:hypothetical protein